MNYREQTLTLTFLFFLCCSVSYGQLNVSLQLTNPACGGFSTGNINAVPVSGQPPYTYAWSNGATNNPLTNIPAGNYTVTVTDFNGLTGTASGLLTEPPPLIVQINVTDCGSPGSLEGDVDGGIPPFTYEWSTGESTPAIDDLFPGLYCLTVTDINSCAFQTCEFIGTPMALFMDADTAFCGTGLGGNATVDATGGVLPYNYEWNNGSTNDTIYNVAPGTYEVTITSENECTQTGSVEVPIGPGSFDIAFDNINPGCAGNAGGSVTAIGTGGIAPYIFTWSTNDTATTVENLPAGTYYVTATDAFGCTATDSTLLVAANPFTISFDSLSPSCFGGADGTASVNVTGGTEPYYYLWNTDDTSQTITGLTAGYYSVFVLDSLDCLVFDSVLVVAPDELSSSMSSMNVSDCGAADGMASVTPGGGNPPYSFIWNNGETTANIEDLSAGLYVVTVTDANDCERMDSALITSPTALTVDISGSNIVCSNGSSGELTADPVNGMSPYKFVWSTGDSVQTINDLPAGTYTVTVTSTDGCLGTASATITNNPPITLSHVINHPTCFGYSNGSISIAVGGGMTPLNILWDNGSNSTIRNNLSGGDYYVTITDALACSRIDTITVIEPGEIDLTFDSSPGSCGTNGFSIAIALGGNMPYTYNWSNGATTAFIDNLAPGNYTVTVSDANNCTVTGTANIPVYPNIDLNLSSTNTTCNGTADGTASAMPTGGTGPFSYLWSNAATTPTITGLAPGTYAVTITDANDCQAFGSTELFLGSGLNVSIDGATALCLGDPGTLTAQALGGAASFTFAWSNGSTDQTISNLGAGTYSVTVTDPNGCTGSAAATLTIGGDFTVDHFVEHVDCFGDNTGRIVLDVANAALPVLFFWSNGTTTENNENLTAGDYAVTVADNSGCTKELFFEIDEPPLLEVTVSGTNGICGNLGSANSSVAGGTMPYFYLWSNGNNNPDIGVLGPGQYNLTVTDAKGCIGEDSTIIDLIPSVSCNIMLLQPVSVINGNDGVLAAMINDGTAPFTYEWNNGLTTPTIDNLSTGNYTVTVFDADNCATSCSFFLMDGARIGDFVWEDTNENGIQESGEPGLENINIELSGTDGYGNPVLMSASTDSDGKYQFDLIPGSYQLSFQLPTGFLASPTLQGMDTELDSNADPLTNLTAVIALGSGMNRQDIDAGFYAEINCDNVVDAGEICCDQTLCAPGDQATMLGETTAPSGGSGSLEYLWMYTDQAGPFDPATWTAVANSNSPTLLPDPLTSSTYFIRRVRRSGCSTFLESNQVAITVYDFPILEISGPDTVCINEPVSFSTNDIGTPEFYNWSFSNANPANSIDPIANNIVWDQIGDQIIDVNIEIDGCPISATTQINISDSPSRCGFDDLILDGAFIDSMTIELDWNYPVSSSVIRTYLVEWSHNNGSFISLGPPDSSNQTGNLATFFYNHENPLVGSNAYRVQLNDSEGNVLVSNIVTFDKDSIIAPPPNTGDYYLVHSFPNPFRNQITVDVYDRFDDIDISLEIYNTLGQLLEYSVIPADMDRWIIETNDFPQGTYMLFVKYGGIPQKVFKLVK